MLRIVARATKARTAIVIPAGALAQAWRQGSRLARLAKLLGSPDVTVHALDERAARAAGQLCRSTGTSDVIDASVVGCATSLGYAIVTSDAGDLRPLDQDVVLVAV